MKNISLNFMLVAVLGMMVAGLARADEAPFDAHLVLANHVFDPKELSVPADRKIKLTITNKDATPAEFESADLGREKVVPANGEIYVYLGPLDPGSYGYYDDFHRDTVTGAIVAH